MLYFLTIVAIAYIIQETNAIYEYAKVFRLPLPFIKEYGQSPNRGSFTYLDFLLVNKSSFFLRLLTCHVCLLTVLGLALSIVQIAKGGAFYMFGVNIVCSWLVYKVLLNLDNRNE